jgi:hypothetical protein
MLESRCSFLVYGLLNGAVDSSHCSQTSSNGKISGYTFGEKVEQNGREGRLN